MRTARLLVIVLLAAGPLVVSACGGSKADLPALATEAADVQPQTAITVVADGLDFDTDTIVVPAGAGLSITLDNQDSGTLHNISVYTESDAERTQVYQGELFEGEAVQTYTFTAPAAGIYLFRCDAHPDMDGAFIAK